MQEKSSSINENKKNEFYLKSTEFYNSFSTFYFEWIKTANLEEKKHPYEKFSRKNDRLYESFKRRTENLQMRDED